MICSVSIEDGVSPRHTIGHLFVPNTNDNEDVQSVGVELNGVMCRWYVGKELANYDALSLIAEVVKSGRFEVVPENTQRPSRFGMEFASAITYLKSCN